MPSQLLDCITKSKAIEILVFLLENGKTQSTRLFDHFYPAMGTINSRVKDLWIPCGLIEKTADLSTNLIYYELSPAGRRVAEELKPLLRTLKQIEEKMIQDGVIR